MFRVRLGKHTVGDNKVVNGDFSTGDLSGWELSYGWYSAQNVGNNEIQYTLFNGSIPAAENPESLDPTIYSLMIQRAILERGRDYRISFEILELVDLAEFVLKIGDWGKDSYNEEGIYVVDRKVLDRGDLVLHLVGEQTITNISAYELKWNDPLEDEPINILSTTNSIVQASDIEGLFVEFIDDLEFVGDGYRYLVEQRDLHGVNGIIPVLIEESEDGYFWENRFEGNINITDVIFDEERKIASAEVNDVGVPALISKNSNKKINIRPAYIDDRPVVEKRLYFYGQPFHLQDNFSPTNSGQDSLTYRIENAFAYIINNITGSRALVISDAFGDPDRWGDHLLSKIYDYDFENLDWNMSFRDLFQIVNSVYNITIGFAYADNVPVVVINHKGDVGTNDISLTFENARITSRGFSEDIPTNVVSGYVEEGDNAVEPYEFTADKITIMSAERRLVPLNVKVENSGSYGSSDVASGDILLVESELKGDPYVFNNQVVPQRVNYFRPFYRSYVNKSPINPEIGNFSFPISNWMVSLPFDFIGANNGVIQEFNKTNPPFIEEIQFESPISKSDWNLISQIREDIQIVPDPNFTSAFPSKWEVDGDWTLLGDGLATINTYSSGAYIRTFFRDNLQSGKKYRARVRMGGWSINKESSFSVVGIDSSGTPILPIGNIIPNFYVSPDYAAYDHIYDFFFTPVNNNISGVAIILSPPSGGSPMANVTFAQFDVYDSIPIQNAQKAIEVNGYKCKILEIERDIKTGLSQITALKEYENAN